MLRSEICQSPKIFVEYAPTSSQFRISETDFQAWQNTPLQERKKETMGICCHSLSHQVPVLLEQNVQGMITILYAKKKWKKPFCYRVNEEHFEKLRARFFSIHNTAIRTKLDDKDEGILRAVKILHVKRPCFKC